MKNNEFVAVSSKYVIDVCILYLSVPLNRVFGLHFVILLSCNMYMLFRMFLCCYVYAL